MNFKFKLSQRLARMKIAPLLAAALTAGCSIPSSPVIARVEGIDITPTRAALVPFQAVDLNVVITMSRADSGAAMGSLQWSTTGGTITNISPVGHILHITYQSPAQPGTYLVIVTTTTGAPADTASVGVTATAVPVGAVAVTPGTKSLAAGDTTTLRATLTDSTGAVVVGRAIEWSSSDQAVAQVLVTGFVRAIGPGTATITARSEDRTGTAVVNVAP